jgi:hypothetical protein
VRSTRQQARVAELLYLLLALTAPLGHADFLSVFGKPQLDALAYLFMRLHGDGITVASVFWGLWLLALNLGREDEAAQYTRMTLFVPSTEK